MIAIDFETFYDKKQDYSVATMGAEAYCRDPRFDAYLVSIYGEGIEYVGTVEDFDWKLAHGKRLCAHNALFDQTVFEVGCQGNQGNIPKNIKPLDWTCTADLAAFLGCKRSLGSASLYLLGRKRDKSTRDKVDGLTLRQAKEQGLEQELHDYCLQDSIDCLDLWEKFNDQWPIMEQKVSRYNRDEGRRGVAIDVPLLESYIKHLTQVRFDIESKIPWDWSGNKTPLSVKKMATYCRSQGLPVPTTTDRKSDECIEWIAKYGKDHPWLEAMQNWRRANTMLNKLQSIQRRLRPDGTTPVELKYFGAHTGRFSGAGGVNMQNLNRGEVMGVNMRKLVIPRPGCKFYIADLSQIEPRTLNVLCGNDEFIKLCETTSPYEAHARVSMNWKGGKLSEENKALYQFAKARVLSLGYGAGWFKFISMASLYITDQEIFDSIFRAPVAVATKMDFVGYLRRTKQMTQAKQFELMPDIDQRVWVNSWLQVTDFRKQNPKITNLWAMLDHEFKQAARSPSKRYDVELPNGRVLSYHDVVCSKGQCKARPVMGGPAVYFYGGKLTENITQAVARDVFVNGYVNLIEAGYHIPFTVHDESDIEAPIGADTDEIKQLVISRPSWFSSCPLDTDVDVVDHYTK